MTGLPTVRIFISSPSDVRSERLIAERVVQRLDREFAYHFHVERVLWEREPLVATHHFQDIENIPPPRTTDIVAVILWSQLGVPLPAEKFSGAVTGKVPVTGTEWEFEDALKAFRESGSPDLLLYHKIAPITASLDDDAALERQRQQKRLVEGFLRQWFRNATDTEFTAALHSFAEAAEFEDRLETHLRALLRKRLGAMGQKLVTAGIRWHQNPFRGLESFEPEHAAIFFGRTRVRHELRELLARQAERGCAFVLVMGASGLGKSSLVKAGLLPDLMLPGMVGRVALCRYALLRPADTAGDLVEALAAAMLRQTALPELEGLRYTRDRLAEQLRDNPKQVAFAVEQGLAAAADREKLTKIAEARLTLVVDQLEELFTLEAITPEARRDFVAALEALARSGLVWVVATMRADFFDRLATLPELAALSAGEARYLLPPPDGAEIGQIIRQPAREAGIRFEVDTAGGVGLDEVLREAAARDPASLPLLEYTLDQLWRRRDAQGVIGYAAYHDLGGLEGAIGRRAEAVLATLPEQVQAGFPVLLRALVTVGQGTKGTVTARWTALASYGENSPQRMLIEAFLSPDARLLVADGNSAADSARVRVAHEALLTHWKRARDQIAEDRSDLQLRARLEQAEGLWAEAPEKDRDSLLLPPGLPLSEAEDFCERRREELEEALATFVGISGTVARAAEQRRLNRLRAVSAVFAGFTIIATGLGIYAIKQADSAYQAEQIAISERRATEIQLQNNGLFQATLLSEKSNWVAAKEAANSALAISRRIGSSNAAALLAFARANAEVPDPYASVITDGQVTALATDGDGRSVAIGLKNGDVQLADALTGARTRRFTGHTGAVLNLGFVDSARFLVSVGEDGTIIKRDLTSGAVVSRLTEAVGRIDLVSPISGEKPFVALTHPRSDQLDNSDTPHSNDKLLLAFFDPITLELTRKIWITGAYYSIALSPDGNTLLLGTRDGLERVDLVKLKYIDKLNGKSHPLLWMYLATAIAVSDDGKTAVVGTSDGVVEFWDLVNGKEIGAQQVRFSSVQSIALPHGNTMTAVVGYANGAVMKVIRRGDTIFREGTSGTKQIAESLEPVQALGVVANTGAIAIPDGRGAVAMTRTGSEEKQPIKVGAVGLAPQFDFSPAGRLLIGYDVVDPESSGPRFFDPATGDRLMTLENFGDYRDARFIQDAGKIVVSRTNGEVELWDMITRNKIASLREPGADVFSLRAAAAAPLAAAVSKDNALLVWNTAECREVMRTDMPQDGLDTYLTLSSAGTVIAVGTRNTLKVVFTDGRQHSWSAGFDKASGLESVAMAPDGQFLLTGHTNGTVRIWSVDDGKTVAVVKAHSAGVQGLGWMRNGELFVSGGREGQLKVWDFGLRLEVFALEGLKPITSISVGPNDVIVAGGFGDSSLYGDFDGYILNPEKVRAYIAAREQSTDARSRLETDPNDAEARGMLRRWYLQRGYGDLAAKLPAGDEPSEITYTDAMAHRDYLKATAILKASIGNDSNIEDNIFAKMQIEALTTDRESFISAAKHGDLARIMFMIDSGISPNVTDDEGRTALHVAVQHRRASIVGGLLRRKSDPNMVSRSYGTPLHAAARIGDVEIIRLLLDAGASLNLPDRAGNTPLYMAAAALRYDAIEYLLSRGANRQAKSKGGMTPYDAAKEAIEKEKWLSNELDLSIMEKLKVDSNSN